MQATFSNKIKNQKLLLKPIKIEKLLLKSMIALLYDNDVGNE